MQEIITDRANFAEKTIYLDGKPFSLDDYPLMRPVYNDDAVKILMLCGRQIGKTVVLDAPILLANNLYKSAKDIVCSDTVTSLNTITQKNQASVVTWKSEVYTKPCVRIQTRLGHVIDVATTHPVRTWDAWTNASDLKISITFFSSISCGSNL